MNWHDTRSRTLRACRPIDKTSCVKTRDHAGRDGAKAFAIFLFFLMAFTAFAVAPAWSGTYASSKSEYWKVGTYDDRLSQACRRGVFNQVNRHNYNILFVGDGGKAITGIAKQNWNLKDPRGLAAGMDAFTFHFFHDGYSDCKVYIARK